MSMEAEIVAAVQLLPFGEGGAELGMTRAEMLDQLHQIENSIMSTLEFQTQIIFGWLVAMFFVAHRLSHPQISVACTLFLGISLLNLGVIVSAISRINSWAGYLYPDSGNPNSLDAVGVLIAILSNGWLQLSFILSVYAACIWWAFSCRRNQPNEIGSPL